MQCRAYSAFDASHNLKKNQYSIMISLLKKILTRKTNNSELTINNDDDSQLETEIKNMTDSDTAITDDKQNNEGVRVEKSSENICSDLVSEHSVSKSSESINDFSCGTEFKENLKPRVILNDCLKKPDRLKKLDARSRAGRRSQRRSAKIAAGKIAKITQSWQYDTSMCVEVQRAPSQRLCAIAAERKISKIIDMSSSESDEDNVEMDESQ